MNLETQIDLIFDTNVLRAEPYYRKEEYKSLKILVDKGIIRVNLPKVVESEYFTQLQEPCYEKFKAGKSAMKELKKVSFVDSKDIDEIENKLMELKEQSLGSLKKNFTDFFDSLNVIRNTLEGYHAENVFEKYFKGEVPFKNKKERADIPDAFIFEVIKDIKKTNDNSVVLVKDNALIKACESESINYYKSLTDFIKTPEIQETLKIEENIQKFIAYLSENKSLESFLESKHITDLEYVTIHDESIIQSEDNSAQIHSIGTPEDIDCDYATYTNYGNSSIGFSSIFDIEVYADLIVFKSDYYSNDYFRNCSSPEDLNEHYYRVEGNFLLSIELDLIVNYSKLDFKEGIENFDELIDDVIFKINGINEITIKDDLSIKPKNLLYKCICGMENEVSYDAFEHEFEGRDYDEKSYTDNTNLSFANKCKCGIESNIKIDVATSSNGFIWEYKINIDNGKLIKCNFYKKDELYDDTWWYNN